jgi:hypothetical protein
MVVMGKFDNLVQLFFSCLLVFSFMFFFFAGLSYGINLVWCKWKADGSANKCIIFSVLRFSLAVAAVSSFVLRFTNINLDLDFDFEYPNWAAASIVSWVDLLISLSFDIYYAGWIQGKSFQKCWMRTNCNRCQVFAAADPREHPPSRDPS